MAVLKTGAEWEKFLGAQILDHDGWRRGNPYGPCDFKRDKITMLEFDRRYRLCTARVDLYMPNPMHKHETSCYQDHNGESKTPQCGYN